MVEKERPEVWDILEEVITEHPVLLNRAPTLHRLGIQAFEPVLIEGKGDSASPAGLRGFQRRLRRRSDGGARAAVGRSADGSARAHDEHEQHPVAGERPADHQPDAGHRARALLRDPRAQVRERLLPRGLADGRQEGPRRRLPARCVRVTATKCAWPTTTASSLCTRDPRAHPDRDETGETRIADARPSVACSSARFCPTDLPFDYVNKVLNKKALTSLIDVCYRKHHNKETVLLADRLRTLGFDYATRAGVSICMDDMVIPAGKRRSHRRGSGGARARHRSVPGRSDHRRRALQQGRRHLGRRRRQRHRRDDERHRQRDDHRRRDGQRAIESSFNPVYIMADSGARGSTQQMRQLAAMRGLMAKPLGRDHRDADHRELPRRAERARSTSSRRTVRVRVWPTPH